uniref:Protein MAK16 homolog n=1 Tax=Spongospora subterranea TaxID=70186 RepID=A0A0H5R9R6_9EUKA|eukprot:CRZ10875.1 hypothetical protein [Spongospora subterranea]
MQHDDMIWSVISTDFCSFKTKTATQDFCRNNDNVTGLCNRASCPLANSRYATIKEDEGKLFLWIKTIERAHSPLNLWEKIALPANYTQSLAVIDKQMVHWPGHMIHRCKQRLTKIHQYLIRMRKLALSVRPKVVSISKKIDRRETRREAKALKAARITNSIKSELLERLKQGTYGDIYNFPMQEYREALEEVAVSDEDEQESEFVEAYDNDVIDDDDMEDYNEDMTDSDDENSQSGDEDADHVLPKFTKRKGRRSFVEIEYETEERKSEMI